MAIGPISETLTGTTPSASAEVGGNFNFSLSGTFSGTVTIQRSFNGGTTWGDVRTAYTSPIEDTGFEPAAKLLYRVVPNLSSGSAVVFLGKGGSKQ